MNKWYIFYEIVELRIQLRKAERRIAELRFADLRIAELRIADEPIDPYIM